MRILGRPEVVIVTYTSETTEAGVRLSLVNRVLIDGLGLPTGIGVTAAGEEAGSGGRGT